MKFSDIIDQASALLQRKGRLTYRSLKLEFALDDEQLAVLKEELIEGQELAVDKDGKMLVWVGEGAAPGARSTFQVSGSQSLTPNPQSPISYTPPHLAERIRAEQAALEACGASDGERKTITALFADLKGSTALIEGLDPEKARALIDPALQLMMDAVHRYDGYVAQARGDGIFALFGAPIAHEDHPQRALYAALRMQDEMRRYGDDLRRAGRTPLQMRVGVNTGEVVVRSIRKDDLHTDYVPVGHSTNLAARMEQLANPGSILVTASTHRLTEGYFEFKALAIMKWDFATTNEIKDLRPSFIAGETQIKGVEEPLPVYEVLGAGPLRTRLQVAARRGLTRFVGRQPELDQLRHTLEQARAGHGQIVGVMGEPGVGKSRLFYEFKLTSQSGGLVLEAYSVSYGKAAPYLPLIELLKSYFQIQLQDDEHTRRERVIGKVLGLDRSLEETLPYLFALLGIEDQPSPLQQMDPQSRRRRTFDAIKKLFLRESLNQPLLLIFEDLHWIDSETQGFLDTLSESLATAKILLLVNYRPEYRQAWGNKSFFSQLRLDPLGQDDAEELLTTLLGNEATLQPLKRVILEKTEGNPFFMEEIVQELVEQGVLIRDPPVGAGLSPAPTETSRIAFHLPTTVQGVLAARIDRLAAAEKELLQQLAVIGREFPLSLLRQVVPQPEEELYRLLASLQRKEFLYEQPAFPEVEYLFKHALTQEVAYGTVLQERRKALHERTAQAIEALYHSSVEDHYSELAHHYSRSGNTEKAIEHLHLAGHQAAQRFANAEAIHHLTNALELLKTLPDTPERTQQELTLQLALGPPLIATKGYGVPEVEHAYTRARELCRQVGETPQLFPALLGLSVFHMVRAEYRTARELGEQCLSLAQRVQAPALITATQSVLGVILCELGELPLARAHAEQGIALYDPQQPRSWLDHGVGCLASAAWALWLLGYPDQALKRSDEMLILAQELSHPYSLGFALYFAAHIRHFRREAHAAQAQAEAALALSTAQGLPTWLANGTVLRGWALATQGQGEAGIAQLHQGLAAHRATGEELGRPHFLALLAEAYGKMGQAEEGLTTLAEALTLVDKTEERCDEAELYRLAGELALRIGEAETGRTGDKNPFSDSPIPRFPVSSPEEAFQKAIEIARRQQAKSLELRAVMSLSRLWQQQGKKDEARQMLAEVYGWFTEGFDTKDLQEARALLDVLAA